jgi:hypothetical protein
MDYHQNQVVLFLSTHSLIILETREVLSSTPNESVCFLDFFWGGYIIGQRLLRPPNSHDLPPYTFFPLQYRFNASLSCFNSPQKVGYSTPNSKV